jgi:hypothetical protein
MPSIFVQIVPQRRGPPAKGTVTVRAGESLSGGGTSATEFERLQIGLKYIIIYISRYPI